MTGWRKASVRGEKKRKEARRKGKVARARIGDLPEEEPKERVRVGDGKSKTKTTLV